MVWVAENFVTAGARDRWLSKTTLPGTEQEREEQEKREWAERLEGELAGHRERPRGDHHRDAAMPSPCAAV